MNDDPVLNIALVINKNVLSFIAANGGERRDVDAFAKRDRPRHGGKWMYAGRQSKRWGINVGVERRFDIGLHPSSQQHGKENQVDKQAEGEDSLRIHDVALRRCAQPGTPATSVLSSRTR